MTTEVTEEELLNILGEKKFKELVMDCAAELYKGLDKDPSPGALTFVLFELEGKTRKYNVAVEATAKAITKDELDIYLTKVFISDEGYTDEILDYWNKLKEEEKQDFKTRKVVTYAKDSSGDNIGENKEQSDTIEQSN